MGRFSKAIQKIKKVADEFQKEDHFKEWDVLEKEFELDNLKELYIKGKVGAGSLKIKEQPAGVPYAQIRCEYDRKTPELFFSIRNGVGELTFSQAGTYASWKSAKQRWTLYLPREIKTFIDLDLGAGSQELHFGQINLASLSIDSGVGSCELDFSQQVTKQIPISINNGIGSMEISLSEATPVRINSKKGIGSTSANGLIMAGSNEFVTKGYVEGQPHLHFDINIGVGSIDWNLLS